jgi:hypothetical protein
MALILSMVVAVSSLIVVLVPSSNVILMSLFLCVKLWSVESGLFTIIATVAEFCEELPVEEAFLNLEDEREYFLKKNMEERKNYQGECIALAKMAAYLPMFLLIILKLVVPFVAEGLSELHAYSQSMTGFF